MAKIKSQSNNRVNYFALAVLLFLTFSIPLTLVAINLGFNPFTRANQTLPPKEVVVANITDSGATIAFITDEPVSAIINYGVVENQLNKVVSDKRDLSSGLTGDYRTHYFELAGLTPNTVYYFTPVIVDTAYKNGAVPFTFKTLSASEDPTIPLPKYGSVNPPTAGALVYAHIISKQGSNSSTASAITADNGTYTFDVGVMRDSAGKPLDPAGLELLIVAVDNELGRGGKTFPSEQQPGSIAVAKGNQIIYANELKEISQATTTTPTQTAVPTGTNQPTTTPTTAPNPTLDQRSRQILTSPDRAESTDLAEPTSPANIFVSNIDQSGFNVNWTTSSKTTGTIYLQESNTVYKDIRDINESQTRYTHSVRVITSNFQAGEIINFTIEVNGQRVESSSYQYLIPSIPSTSAPTLTINGTRTNTHTETDTSDYIVASKLGSTDSESTFKTTVANANWSIEAGDSLLITDQSSVDFFPADSSTNTTITAYGEFNSRDGKNSSALEQVQVLMQPKLAITNPAPNQSYNNLSEISGIARPSSGIKINLNGREYTTASDTKGNWVVRNIGLIAGTNTLTATDGESRLTFRFNFTLNQLPDTSLENWQPVLFGVILIVSGILLRRYRNINYRSTQ